MPSRRRGARPRRQRGQEGRGQQHRRGHAEGRQHQRPWIDLPEAGERRPDEHHGPEAEIVPDLPAASRVHGGQSRAKRHRGEEKARAHGQDEQPLQPDCGRVAREHERGHIDEAIGCDAAHEHLGRGEGRVDRPGLQQPEGAHQGATHQRGLPARRALGERGAEQGDAAPEHGHRHPQRGEGPDGIWVGRRRPTIPPRAARRARVDHPRSAAAPRWSARGGRPGAVGQTGPP